MTLGHECKYQRVLDLTEWIARSFVTQRDHELPLLRKDHSPLLTSQAPGSLIDHHER